MLIQTETPSQRATRAFIESVNAAAESRVRHWQAAFRRLWSPAESTPAEILALLGTGAAQVFAMNAAEASDIVAQLTAYGQTDQAAQVTALLATIPSHTIHADGTVTLDPVPDPEPIPEQ